MSVDVPKPLQPYVDVLGMRGTVDFLLRFGGAPIYLSLNPRATSEIVDAIGREKTIELAKRLQPGWNKLHLYKPFIARYLASEGDSILKIARTLHMKADNVRSYVREDRQESFDFSRSS